MQREDGKAGSLPARFADLKRSIVPDEESKARVEAAWNDLLGELLTVVGEIKTNSSSIIPQVEFSELQNLTLEQIDLIKRRGTVLIKNVVDDYQAISWREEPKKYVKTNPVEGFPEEDKQFFELHWTRPQVQARAHPNVLLQLGIWLNNLYHLDASNEKVWIRHPGVQRAAHPPHIDGATIERWEDRSLRDTFGDILRGEWRKHDPYNIASRLQANYSMYGRPEQASVFRTFQGWLALSETSPHEGTLQVFPDVFDIGTPAFPGIFEKDGRYWGPRLTSESHPHMRLEETMISVPAVRPGDMEDSAVVYIPAVPLTPQNIEYVKRQKETFLKGATAPDFPKTAGEGTFIGVGKEGDVIGELARRAMGLAW
ncbi:hypothetical protein ACEPAF_4659 [Sanghuangporus sanghuang]